MLALPINVMLAFCRFDYNTVKHTQFAHKWQSLCHLYHVSTASA